MCVIFNIRLAHEYQMILLIFQYDAITAYKMRRIFKSQGPRNSGAEWAPAPALFLQFFSNEKSERVFK